MSRRSGWLLSLARWYARRGLSRGLDGLWVEGLERARAAAREGPLLLAANHVAWWDAFLLVRLDEALGTEGRALTDADNLRRLPYFRPLGALPLHAARPLEGLRRGAAHLQHPGRAVWIFPQGRQRPAHLRPLDFQRGVALLARMAPRAAVIPISLQYAFAEAPVPRAYVVAGEPMPAAAVAEGVEQLERAVTAGLERIDRALSGGGSLEEELVSPRWRSPERGIGARLLRRAGWGESDG